MSRPPEVSDEEVARLWAELGGNITELTPRIGYTDPANTRKRLRYMRKRGFDLPYREDCASPGGGQMTRAYHAENRIEIDNGSAVMFSDLHVRPLARRGGDTPAMEALLNVLDVLGDECRLKLLNGDVFDFSAIGRHPPHGWESRPTVDDEIEAGRHDLGRIERAGNQDAELLGNIGNHDIRFDRRLAERVPEYRNVAGMSLAEHFRSWRMAWATVINGNLRAMHRWAGGVHAAYNNVMKSGGVHIVSADTHRLKVQPYTSQTGAIFYGIETGTLADPDAETFEYTAGVRPNWQPGFCVLTWRGGVLLPPETVPVHGRTAWFRGRQVAG